MNRVNKSKDNDTLYLTKSQITNDTDMTDILEQVSTFKIYFNSCTLGYQNFASVSVKILFYQSMKHFQAYVLHIKKCNFSHDAMIYCCQ